MIKNLYSIYYCCYSNDVIVKYVYVFIFSNINCSYNFSSVRSDDGMMIIYMNMLIFILLCGIVMLLIWIIFFIMILKV